MVPTVAPSVANTNAITGIVISVAGNCMMPSSSVASASRPAPGTPFDQKRDADQQHLNERDADHALRDGANGGGTQFGDRRSPLRSGYA